jgi:hypothetical protein
VVHPLVQLAGDGGHHRDQVGFSRDKAVDVPGGLGILLSFESHFDWRFRKFLAEQKLTLFL